MSAYPSDLRRLWDELSGRIPGVSAALVSAVAAGLVAGALSRLIMRLMILAYPVHPSHFSWGGTAFIMASTLFPTMALGLVYVAIQQRLPGRPWVKGLQFGALVALVLGLPLLLLSHDTELIELDGRRFGGPGLLALSLYMGLFLLTGAILARSHQYLTPRFAERPRTALAALLLTAAPAAMGFIMIAGGISEIVQGALILVFR